MKNKEEANLGLATTRELIEELKARWEVAHPIPGASTPMSLQVVERLFTRDGSMDYRTVD